MGTSQTESSQKAIDLMKAHERYFTSSKAPAFSGRHMAFEKFSLLKPARTTYSASTGA